MINYYWELSYQITEESRRQGLMITPNARRIITSALYGLRKDPHWSWKADVAELVETENAIVKKLPSILLTMSSKEGSHDIPVISTFDVLHWIEENLSFFCPFDKQPPATDGRQ